MAYTTPEDHLFQTKWGLHRNPFVFNSAESLDDASILQLFVADPDSSLAAFSFNVNNIIRGAYGCGKTMCLRAVEAFAMSQMLIDIVDTGRTGVLPVLVNLADVGHLAESEHIYHAILHQVFLALGSLGRRVRQYVEVGGWFTPFRDWRKALTESGIYAGDDRYDSYPALEIEDRVRKAFAPESKQPASSLLSALATAATREKFLAITDLNRVHADLLAPYCDRLLLLVDEFGSLQPDFYVTKGAASSRYETLMNQLRTSQHVFYKICVYPGHYSDALQETRYGTRINLDYPIADLGALQRYEVISRNVLWKYIHATQNETDKRTLSDFIELSPEPAAMSEVSYCARGPASAFEQLCLGSLGVMRRLFTLSSKTMLMAASRNPVKVNRMVVQQRLETFGAELIERHTPTERNQLKEISAVCKAAGTYKFSAEIDTRSLLKPFLSKTEQDSVLAVLESRSGRPVYQFDYAYCVANQLPTHAHPDSKEDCPARTLTHGAWIDSVEDVTETVLNISGLTRGVIVRYLPERQFGFIIFGSDEPEAFFHLNDIIEWDDATELDLDKRRVRFALGDSPRGKKARAVAIEPRFFER